MTGADIKTGNPKVEGRYLTFLRCQAPQARHWVEPVILTWSGDRWHTSFIAQNSVLGWIGPIPVMKADDLEKPKMEFDL